MGQEAAGAVLPPEVGYLCQILWDTEETSRGRPPQNNSLTVSCLWQYLLCSAYVKTHVHRHQRPKRPAKPPHLGATVEPVLSREASGS